MSPGCYKGCAEWKASGGGSLFDATEPKGCDCDKVMVTGVTETLSPSNRMIVSNRGFFSSILSFFGDRPQDMTSECFKGCAEWKASIGGSLFDATEPTDCDCDKVTVEKVEENFPEENRKIEMTASDRGLFSSINSIFHTVFGDKPQDMSQACYKGCAEWKASGGGSLFEASEPKDCDCDKVTVTGVTETFSPSNRMIKSNRGLFSSISSIFNTVFGDRPQDMSQACYKGCAEWKASGGGSLFEASEPK